MCPNTGNKPTSGSEPTSGIIYGDISMADIECPFLRADNYKRHSGGLSRATMFNDHPAELFDYRTKLKKLRSRFWINMLGFLLLLMGGMLIGLSFSMTYRTNEAQVNCPNCHNSNEWVDLSNMRNTTSINGSCMSCSSKWVGLFDNYTTRFCYQLVQGTLEPTTTHPDFSPHLNAGKCPNKLCTYGLYIMVGLTLMGLVVMVTLLSKTGRLNYRLTRCIECNRVCEYDAFVCYQSEDDWLIDRPLRSDRCIFVTDGSYLPQYIYDQNNFRDKFFRSEQCTCFPDLVRCEVHDLKLLLALSKNLQKESDIIDLCLELEINVNALDTIKLDGLAVFHMLRHYWYDKVDGLGQNSVNGLNKLRNALKEIGKETYNETIIQRQLDSR